MLILKRLTPLFTVLLVLFISMPVYAAHEVGTGSGSGGDAGYGPPEDVAESFWDIYFKWIDPIREASTGIVLLMLLIVTFSALMGGGVERLVLVKKYLIVAAIALFLIWNALPLTFWLRDLFLKK